MATINGVSFNLQSLIPVVYHRNVDNEVLGSDNTFFSDMGFSGTLIEVTGYETTLAKYDEVISEFMKTGAQTLVHISGWQYSVYSTQLMPTTIQSTVNYYRYSLLLKTSSPYRESTSETTRTKTITTNNQEWSADNSSNDIDTDGSVDAVPDIEVTGNGTLEVNNSTDDSNYNFNNSLSGVTITQATSNSAQVIDTTYGVGQTFDCRKVGLAIIDSVQIDVVSLTTGATVYCTVYDKVGGTQLGLKSLSITTTGLKTFTFDTPIAIVQDDNTCTNGTDNSRVAIFISTFSGNMTIGYQDTSVYSDGMLYVNSSGGNQDYPTKDLKFVLTGHSCKEIQQTFEVPVATKLISIILEICKYQYTGTNPVTVIVKEGATTLGTGTVVLSGSTFSETRFILSEETTDSLLLSASTTYTIEITPPTDTGNATGVLIKTNSTNVYSGGSVTLIEEGGTSRAQSQDLNFIAFLCPSNTGVQIYNIADSSIKCGIANEILYGAIHRINSDGTGTVYYDDDFSTEKWTWNSIYLNITHDTINDELDIADDGYIYWKIDTKGSVTGIPTLTSQINITSGAPTIQISSDASTWYDITTAIVDDVDTEYELDSSSFHLKGLTEFYWRIDCVKAAAATCSIKSFELDINMVTIDFEHPTVSANGTSTFRCNQDAASGMACNVSLIYRDRSWPV